MDWVTTFTRFSPGRTALGPVEVRVEDWSRPQAGEAPMFDNRLLERLTCAHPGFPLAVYLPAGVALAWYAIRTGVAGGIVAVAYLSGLFGWTLLEYVAHRVSFHHVPTTPGQVAYGYLVHGVHHAYPEDSRRWVLPIAISFPIAAFIFWLFTLTLGRVAYPAYAGFIHGYLTYDLLHYAIHNGRMPTRLGRWLRQYHLSHHYASPDRHFGVSTPLWDVVFRTK
jgi:sterol desaturase/sphingolipid hydroxylase (fatty acid hydroxylase superfamily)